jgi:hypothetical protein
VLSRLTISCAAVKNQSWSVNTPESISSEAFEKHADVIRKFVRGRNGVYALYRRGKLYYSGLASDLRGRLRHHSRDRHKQLWDTLGVYLTIGDQHLRELELLILRVAQPPGNRQLGKQQQGQLNHSG